MGSSSPQRWLEVQPARLEGESCSLRVPVEVRNLRLLVRTLWLGGGLVLLASAGAALWLHEARIARVVDREMKAIDAARPVTEDSRRVERAIDDLHALIRVCGSEDANHGATWKWAIGFDAAPRDELDWNAPFFAEVDALVLSPSFERVLESDARLESTPSLLWGRRRTNLLCARAVVDARDGRSEEGARRLAQALDVGRAHFGAGGVSAILHLAWIPSFSTPVE